MKLEIKQIVEIFGLFGVIASLVFVGYQISLDRKVAISEQYQSRIAIVTARWQAQLESDDYITMMAKLYENYPIEWWTDEFEAVRNDLEFSTRDIAVVVVDTKMLLWSIDNNYFQYQNGLFEENAWVQARSVLKENLRNSLLRPIILGLVESLRPQTSSLINEVLQEIRQESI